MTPEKRKTDPQGDSNYKKREIDVGEHDEICDRRISWMKTAIFVLFTSVVGGGLVGYTQGQDMGSQNEVQDERISENSKDIGELKGALGEHMKEQKTVNNRLLEILGTMKTDLAVIKNKVN